MTRFHKVFMWFSLPLICHKRPHTMQTDKNLHPHLTVSATVFLLACLSQNKNGRACLHEAFLNVDLVDTFFQNIAFCTQSTETQQKGDKESRLLQKQEKATSLWKNTWQSLLFCFSRLHAFQTHTHNANDKIVNHMSSMQSSYQNLIMRPSSFNIFCRYPSAESRKKQHSTQFSLHCFSYGQCHCTQSRFLARKKSHLRVSATFLLACLPPSHNLWKIMHVSLQHLPSHSTNNRIAETQLLDWSL